MIPADAKDLTIRVIIDFDDIEIDDLAAFLSGIRSLLIRAALSMLTNKDTPDSEGALSRLEEHSKRFVHRHRKIGSNKVHDWGTFLTALRRPSDISGIPEPDSFDEWTQLLARSSNIRINSIRLGSYDFGIWVGGLLFLMWPQAISNYSLAKDLLNQMVLGIQRNSVFPRRGHLSDVPKIVDKLLRSPDIKKLEIHATETSVDIKAQFDR